MTRQVACPILRQGGRVLAFRHPLAGLQLVKGGIEPGETPEAAALRELQEEAGVEGRDPQLFGRCTTVQPGEVWHLVAVTADQLPDRWDHRCSDDGGHDFAFFWHDPAGDTSGFDPRYVRVLKVLK
ncbi:NUDIX hydrolase [Jannaschia pohangensis]|uniref:NUDIX domain-containing protein n=1 Tax=Jannaschia pohangensis TaxID=390807 RepID=A0A1I3LIN8_9RHOB|nr:NUDIX domain-containing protein [Jannaschia pohangensis]SFI84410.1 NUDIX domain-containing protein [Jannaschia pohangensis]